MSTEIVLMVAEKPSISESISKILSSGKMSMRRGKTPVYEFFGSFKGLNVKFKVTSVAGHVYEVDFPQSYASWEKTDPISLFDAPIIKNESSSKVISHLIKESKDCNYLVLWLDCDREGENICFEIISVVYNNMSRGRDFKDWIFRARFSSLSFKDVHYAMNNLVAPNKNESDAVDVRQELDLKVGVAFSRLQTTFLKSKFGEFSKNAIISYGPCQTPTLFFAVKRRDEINSFLPEKYYTISVVITKDSKDFVLNWCRSRLFDLSITNCFIQKIQNKSPIPAFVKNLTNFNSKKIRPLPLNTVNMLKLSSEKLGIGPFQTLNLAEKLYLSGFTTYPRTETSKYPKSFDIKSTVSLFKSHPIWGKYALQIFESGYNSPRKDGLDAGDHPPITPVKSATRSDLDGDLWKLYELITSHFFETIYPDAKLANEIIKFDINGELFMLQDKKIIDRGYLIIQNKEIVTKSLEIPEFIRGESVEIKKVEVLMKETKPPSLLTESDLLSLMEKNGIGTDASMPTHIQKIQEREYVKLISGRKLEPTKLGTALIHGLMNVDYELVLPRVRSEIEKYVDLIAKGKYNSKAVLKHSISVFKLKFLYFAENLILFESLFQLSFTNISSSCTRISRCGQCKRYMTYISNSDPQKLYCSFCETYLSIPQKGTIKLYKELKCPLDEYELILFIDQKGKKSIFCPRCYNDPPLTNAKENMLCKMCPHQSCNFSLRSSYLMACPNENCKQGIITLDFNSSPNWKFDCSKCSVSLLIKSQSCNKAILLNKNCPKCASRFLKLDLKDSEKEVIEGCPICCEQINNQLEILNMFKSNNFRKQTKRDQMKKKK